ncbi:aspartyl-phosphate phosphatase Spo0E family protein [Cytobacillus sp. S13-E01]|uniref:aspartyl-phosphate phosphatase Spo0E family protein n=1 Tax=Cytobacillus sp. S13-E01 TaxID=3031326 RepID=UPI0023D8A4C1|nr:aspartyl-phosphate phosphatase Spo0E family protein [Cytobacillus sp. S13-E01]MDF0728138.1 aspartyl-phosphate phosphatase Spo0E family protein [Cytobacillus sp. S13-E01]
MENMQQRLLSTIEKESGKLTNLVNTHGLGSEVTINQSQKLDQLIIEYQKIKKGSVQNEKR